jgi:hypothetical protein
MFHPFQLFPVHRILEACDLRIAKTATLKPDSYMRLTQRSLTRMPGEHEIQALSQEWNRVAREFGLFTDSSVRWYVEGDTEYFAVQEILGDPERYGIELLNLNGQIANFQLHALLREDCAMKRFSVITFDGDVDPNRKFIRHQIQTGTLVGQVVECKPDFEFHNFTFAELIEVAARMDESFGFSGSPIREAPCNGITNSKSFEEGYRSVSTRSRGKLKCEAWGRALGRYALEHPTNDAGEERPIVTQARAAMWGWSSDYEIHFRNFTLDPHTFRQVPRPRENSSSKGTEI